jgi:hypothetical protein
MGKRISLCMFTKSIKKLSLGMLLNEQGNLKDLRKSIMKSFILKQ